MNGDHASQNIFANLRSFLLQWPRVTLILIFLGLLPEGSGALYGRVPQSLAQRQNTPIEAVYMTTKPDLPWFPFFPNDWLSSTDIGLMSSAEEGAYVRLLCHEWNAPDCGLPNEDVELAVLSRLGQAWPNSAPRIRKKFVATGDRLFNEKLVTLWRHAVKKSKNATKAGKLSGRSRRVPTNVEQTLNERSNERSTNVDTHARYESESSSSSGFEVVKAELQQTALADSWFDEFWSGFWRKVAKVAAKKAFLRKITTPERFATVMAAMRSQLPSMMLKEEQFRPHASTWINGERWDDDTPQLPGIGALNGGERAVLIAQQDLMMRVKQ